MASVDMDEAISVAHDIIRLAHVEGNLHHLTPRLVREDIETRMKLPKGTLEVKERKRQLTEKITSFVELLAGERDVEQHPDGMSSEPSSSTRKPKSEKERGQAEEKEKKKPKSRSTEQISTSEESKRNGKRKSSYKSSELVNSDDEGTIHDTDTLVAADKGGRQVGSDVEVEKTPPKKRKKAGDSNTAKLKKPRAPNSASAADKMKKAAVESEVRQPDIVSVVSSASVDVARAEVAEKSDSELSVLIDDPPTKKKKSTKEKKPKGDLKKPREKKGAKELSADEEQIKKLKSLVVACGIRKMWSKELKDCPTPSSQIAHLRRMLSELGMTGRFSMEQAKTIKDKRDLAKEIDDVREFAQKHAGERPKRSAAAKRKSIDEDEERGDEDEDDEVAQGSAPRRSKNAHRSIMAFLGDQSDSD